MRKILLITALILIEFACISPRAGNIIDKIPYDLQMPVETLKLKKDLVELSGLAFDGENLVAIQDEEGKLYFLDPETGEIRSEIKFGKDADYEGVEVVNKDIYVLRSDGVLFRIKDAGKKDSEVMKYETKLRKQNDAEGLVYHQKENALLIMAKESPKIADDQKNVKDKKACYLFDLDDKKLKKDPFFIINLKEVDEFRKEKFGSAAFSKRFKPSAISIHPESGQYYILSSTSGELLVLGSDFKIFDLVKLHKEVSAQPESITFGKSNRLFIGSEGDLKDATIQYYDQKD